MTPDKMNNPISRGASRLGFWFALLLAIDAAVALATAVTTLPLSGPFCQSNCVTYPFNNMAAYVPHDYIWMYPAILLAPLFIILMVCVHTYAPDDKKLLSRIALAFALIYAAVMSTNYAIQIETMQPSIFNGETEGLALFSQYNPHGIFIALEDLGYLMMSLAFFFSAWIFSSRNKLENAIRWLLGTSSILAFAAYLIFSLLFGKALEYRFEVFIISINWLTLIAAGVLLSIFFKRAAR